MNTNKPSGRVPSLDRHLKGEESREPVPVRFDVAFFHDLNKSLEELAELSTAGESARTFFAAVKLIAERRPTIVILENVSGAPWSMYTDQIFPRIGYVARFVRLDSKNFYLPQTRQRGYLVAINCYREIPSPNEPPAEINVINANRIARAWTEWLQLCQRPASAPVTEFLRSPDDPSTILARADMESKPCTNSDWSLSSLRHIDARRRANLRHDDNPFSMKAMRGGQLIHMRPPDHSWRPVWKMAGPRILDLMDIVFAVSLKDGIDLGYKTAMIDVSQNVDRNEFCRLGRPKARNLGIVGCVTPSGLPIMTDEARPLTGTETLALQGLPAEELVLSTETQAQQRDLAGNAMSVPVVGAATYAAILAIAKVEPELFRQMTPEEAQRRHGLYVSRLGDQFVQGKDGGTMTTDVSWLIEIASQMRRVCFCPIRPSKIYVCKTCGVTACPSCSGNPPHNFGDDMADDLPNCSVERGKSRLKDCLPGTIMMFLPSDQVKDALRRAAGGIFRDVALEVLGGNDSELPFYYFDDIKVTESITICYKAVNSIARLVLCPATKTACWYIYIAPWHSQLGDLARHFDVNQPIARGQVNTNILVPTWSVWIPGRVELRLELQQNQHGEVTIGSLDYVNSEAAHEHPDLPAWKATVESKIRGTYTHSPQCGTAGRALHVKQPQHGDSKVFLMWESLRLEVPEKDHFVWTEMPRRIESHEYREVLLCADTSKPFTLQPEQGVMKVYWNGHWSNVTVHGPLTPATPLPELAVVFWGPTAELQQRKCHSPESPESPIVRMAPFAGIQAPLRRFPASKAYLSKFRQEHTDSDFYVVPAAGRDAFLRRFAFLSKEIRQATMPEDGASFPHLHMRWISIDACDVCSVSPPKAVLLCKEEPRKDATGKNRDARLKKLLVEDPEDAEKFEKQLQELPNAVTVAVRLSPSLPNNGQIEELLDIRILLQPKTLASRALAYIRQGHPSTTRGADVINDEYKASFLTELDYAFFSTRPDFAPFRNSVKPCGDHNTHGIDLTNNTWKMPAGEPPRFLRRVGRSRQVVQHRLRPSQRDAVKWMIQRERIPLSFIKREIEEEVVQPLNLRVAGKAEWTTRFPYSSRGGVVAHEIGYGKTVVTLALVDYMHEYDTTISVEERIREVDGAWRKELGDNVFQLFGSDAEGLRAESFFHHLSATLVIVPRHITDQWAKEIDKFLGLSTRNGSVLVIKTSQAFHGKYTLQELNRAQIIIVSSSVFGPSFREKLEEVSGCGVELAKGLSGRALDLWYREALRNHRILTAFYLAARRSSSDEEKLISLIEKSLLPQLNRSEMEKLDNILDKQVQGIDRTYYKSRLRDNTVEPKQQKNTGATLKFGHGTAEGRGRQGRDAQSTKSPVGNVWSPTSLHACSFARIVWDECSYDDDKDSYIPVFVANAVANSKWLLSGTPKLFDLGAVCRLANAFGVHLARPEPRLMPGLPAITEGPKPEQLTPSEQFYAYSSSVKSSSLAVERHNQGHSFVSQYFRCNLLEDEEEIEFEETVVPIAMAPVTAIRYYLLAQEVLDAGEDYSLLPEHARSQIKLKGSDLATRDVKAQARMLLGLMACGLGQNENVQSIDDVKRDLDQRVAGCSRQFKMLFDKQMFLWSWINLLHDLESSAAWSDPVKDSLEKVEFICSRLTEALLGNKRVTRFDEGDLYPHEAQLIAPHVPGDDPEGSRTIYPEWEDCLNQDWAARFRKSSALYTWIDFFDISDCDLNKLHEEQLRSLAKDILYLRCKIDPDVRPLERQPGGAKEAMMNQRWLENALEDTTIRRIAKENAATIDMRVEKDLSVITQLSKAELVSFIKSCQDAKSRQMERDAANADRFDQCSTRELRDLCLEHNLKVPGTTGEMKSVLKQHLMGTLGREHYRDGRAPVNRYRSFQAAMACENRSLSHQISRANEELKQTLVHLTKTIEDLRAAKLEGGFVPGYDSLTKGDNDTKTCAKCRRPLPDDLSFIVVACGHFLCEDCKKSAGFYCPVNDCLAFVHERPVLSCSEIRRLYTQQEEAYETRAAAVVDLVKHRIPRDEFVVVFAQYGLFVEALDTAFRNSGLRYTNLSKVNDENIAAKLEDFKNGNAGQILLLDIDNETSAGSNLTNANHVIFANPFVHHDEEHQSRTVRQARGRCVRIGQTRKVHVYHFMAPGTIEEQTLRHYSEYSKDVSDFFEKWELVPWWMDRMEKRTERSCGHS